MFVTKFKASIDDRSPYGDFWFTPVSSRTGGQNVSPDRSLSLPVVLACVRVLSESFAVLPPFVYQKAGSSRKRLDKHWLLDLFRKPNQYQTGFEWKEMVQGHLALRGNAYNLIGADRSGQITSLTPLHPDCVAIKLIGDTDYRYEYTQRDGSKVTYTRADIWHLRGLSSDGIIGISPIGMARESVGLGLAAQEYGSRFFQNDAKPGGGWIEFPGNFKDKAQRDTFRESFQEAQSGQNRGKVGVLEYGMKYHELGMSNVDSQFLEARQFQIGDIARIFRVPPHLVGDLSKATFSNIEQQSLDFVIHTMTPWAERWESSIETNLLLDSESDIEVEFNFTGLLRGDQVARSQFYHAGVLDGWMTRNEARESEGREPLEGLDEPLIPLNMITQDQADANAQAQVDAANAPNPAVTPEPKPPSPQPEQGDDANARMKALIAGNVQRMARRIAADQAISAEILADALAIKIEAAAEWLSRLYKREWTQQALIASLTELAHETL